MAVAISEEKARRPAMLRVACERIWEACWRFTALKGVDCLLAWARRPEETPVGDILVEAIDDIM
jgi:hypothetical protein